MEFCKRLYITKKLNIQLEDISNITRFVYLASYRWLEESITHGITKIESDFTNALYKYMRMVFDTHGNPELTDRIWFSIFSENNGYYSLDSGAIERILGILKQRKYVSEFSPAYHISSLLGLEMPFDKSFSKYAITKKEYEEFSLPKASYISDMAHIYKTEEQMTGGTKYAIYPISRIGDRELVVSFPADIKSEDLPVLKTHKKKLSNIYETEVGGMNKHIKTIRANYSRLDSAEIGGLIGGIIGGFYRVLS